MTDPPANPVLHRPVGHHAISRQNLRYNELSITAIIPNKLLYRKNLRILQITYSTQNFSV